MSQSILVEVTRGNYVESLHAGILALIDAEGGVVTTRGDVDLPVFPRSAIKAFQALPLIETGAADRAGFGPAEIALACSSHNAEQRHLDTALRMLQAVGETPAALECGPQLPAREADQAALYRANAGPTPLHNNCSGKHAGFIAASHALGIGPEGYIKPDHLLQREIKSAIEAIVGVPLREELRGRDGCSIPTYATPMKALAHGFARFATGQGFERERARAAARILSSCLHEPFMVAGTDRFCTEIMTAFKGKVFVKTGAEGVFCGVVPDFGLGIALKCLDGATRAAEAMMAATLAAIFKGRLSDEEAAVLESYWNKPITDRLGVEVGRIRCRPA